MNNYQEKIFNEIVALAKEYGLKYSEQFIPTGDLYRSIAANNCEAAYINLKSAVLKLTYTIGNKDE